MINTCGASIRRYTIVVCHLYDFIRMACHARLVAEYIVTREEDTVARNQLARLKQHDITHDNILYIDVPLAFVTQDFDKTTRFVLIVPQELPCILPVIQQESQDNDGDNGSSSNATNPVHHGSFCEGVCTKTQKETDGEKKYCRNRT